MFSCPIFDNPLPTTSTSPPDHQPPRPAGPQAHMLLLAHLAREEVPPPLAKDLAVVLTKSPGLLQEMQNIACIPRHTSQVGGRAVGVWLCVGRAERGGALGGGMACVQVWEGRLEQNSVVLREYEPRRRLCSGTRIQLGRLKDQSHSG